MTIAYLIILHFADDQGKYDEQKKLPLLRLFTELSSSDLLRVQHFRG
jgi:hypothetical protein